MLDDDISVSFISLPRSNVESVITRFTQKVHFAISLYQGEIKERNLQRPFNFENYYLVEKLYPGLKEIKNEKNMREYECNYATGSFYMRKLKYKC